MAPRGRVLWPFGEWGQAHTAYATYFIWHLLSQVHRVDLESQVLSYELRGGTILLCLCPPVLHGWQSFSGAATRRPK